MSDIIDKVKALLAKADRTDNEHERDAYYSKAQELITKHAIDEAQLSPEERAKFIQKTVTMSPKVADHTLLHVVAIHNTVKYVKYMNRVKGAVNKQRYGWLFGTEADIAFVEMLYASLLLHRESELRKAMVTDKPSWEHGKQFGAAFRTAYANRINKRLDAWVQKANDAVGEGTALVLFDKSKLVDNFTADTIGKTVSIARRSSASAAGIASGQDAANRADISGGKRNVGGHKRALT